ncbi:MAG TPA: hypothetical protein VGX95_01420 [Xanthobacteraceae bacterium]|jgi:hypothetical protein|nr:hypothetical protein [Xanthobacteraceae bacterium]
MSLMARLRRQSTMTGLGACFFIGGVLLLFIALYHDAARAGPLLWIAGASLIAAVACWVASARAETPKT